MSNVEMNEVRPVTTVQDVLAATGSLLAEVRPSLRDPRSAIKPKHVDGATRDLRQTLHDAFGKLRGGERFVVVGNIFQAAMRHTEIINEGGFDQQATRAAKVAQRAVYAAICDPWKGLSVDPTDPDAVMMLPAPQLISTPDLSTLLHQPKFNDRARHTALAIAARVIGVRRFVPADCTTDGGVVGTAYRPQIYYYLPDFASATMADPIHDSRTIPSDIWHDKRFQTARAAGIVTATPTQQGQRTLSPHGTTTLNRLRERVIAAQNADS